jgi:uncharacterized membrane protein
MQLSRTDMAADDARGLTRAMTETEQNLTIVAAICAGLCAGVFFAFSTFVMPALHRLDSGAAIGAMQAINRAAPNGPFMTVLFAPLAVLAWLIVAVVRKPGSATAFVVAGTVCFVAGLVVLAAYHVPHNNALDRVGAHAPGAAEKWRDYYAGWTAWNHVRTVAFTAAAACFTLALRND